MDKIVIFVLCFYFCSAKITIKNLDVPPLVSIHEDGVVLDCDFDSQGESVDFVKWFLNGTSKVIYQWILSEKKGPQVRKEFEDQIDRNYAVSDDSQTMYRAIHIKKLSPNLSGNYSCEVSGSMTEDVKTKRMIIYDPPDSGLELNITEASSDPSLNESVIFCSAEGVYPEPDLKIYISLDNITETEIPTTDEIAEFDDDDDRYDVSATALYDTDSLSGSFFYTCQLSIPDTEYTLRETRKHTLESDNDTRTESEEDYSNLFNSTNTTSSVEESQEFETQIEENKMVTLKTETTDEPTSDKDDADNDDTVKTEDTKNLKDNASLRHFPSISLLSTVATVLGFLYL